MNLIIFAALIAACGAAKLDRTYLPPASAASAGGSPGSLQTPFSRLNQGTQSVGDIPPGGFVNQYQGVVVDAASADTRATNPLSGLGAPRISYGSTASKVGEAAFRLTATNQFQYNPGAFGVIPGEPDLSAFHQPISSSKPGNFQIVRDYVSNTVKYQNDIGNDKYNYAFETDNGIKASENGVSTDGVQAQGGYSYTGDDGQVYSVVYTAGEDGYKPSGNHLPTPPPIPAEILKSLEQNAKEEAAGVVDDGSYDAQKYNTEDDYTKNDANGKYNDKQSNKFGDRPGSGSNGFINQQAFVSPNFNGQFGSNNVKVPTFSEPGSSQFGNVLGQNNNGFNNKNEYLPPKGTTFGKPSSYDTSNPGLAPSNGITSKPTFSAGSSFGNGNSNSPFNTGSSFDSGNPNLPSNTGSLLGNGNSNSPFNTGSSFDTGNPNLPSNTGSLLGNGNSNSPFNSESSFGNGNSNSPSNTGSLLGDGNTNSPFNTESSFDNGYPSSPSNTGSLLGNGNSNSTFNTGSSFDSGNPNSPSNTGSLLGNGNLNSPFNTGSSFGNGNPNLPSNTGSLLGNGNLNSPFNTGSSFGNGNPNLPSNTGSLLGNGNLNSPFNTGSSFGNGNPNSPSNTGSLLGNGNLNSPFNTESSFGNGNPNLPSNTGSLLGNGNLNSPFNTGSSSDNGNPNSPSNTGSLLGNGNSNSPFNTGSSFGNGNSNSPFNTGSSFGNGNPNSPSNTGSLLGNGNPNSPFNTGSLFGNENKNSPFSAGNSFGIGNPNSPSNTGSLLGNGNPNSPFNTGSSFGNENSNSARPGQTFGQRPTQQIFGGDASLTQESFANQPINSNDNSASNFGIPTSNVQTDSNINNRFSESDSSSSLSGNFKPSLGTSFDLTLKPVSPTKQPQLTLTTSLESFGDSNSDKQSTDTDTNKSDSTKEPALSFTIGQTTPTEINESGQTDSEKPQGFGSQTIQTQENQPQIFSSNQPKDVNFASTTQSPSRPFGQSLGPDDSYVYNRPSKPFNTPSSLLGSNENNKPSSQFDKDGTSQTSLFTNSPQSTTFSFNSQGSTKYPNPPTLAQIVPGTSNLQDIDRKQNGYQQNTGITQASISPFPSLKPTVSSNFKQPSQFTFKPNQQNLPFKTPSVSAFSQAGPTSATATVQISEEQSETQTQEGNTNAPNQQYNAEVYEYNVPTQGLSSQNQKPLNITEREPILTSQSTDLNTAINEDNLSTKLQSVEQLSNLFNQGSSPSILSQKPTQTTQFGLQSGTQFTQDSTAQNQDNGFSLTSTTSQLVQGISNNQDNPTFTNANKQTSIQPTIDTLIPISSLSQNKPELSYTGSQLDKQETQSSSELGLGSLGEKDSDVAILQQPNQQSTSQFGYKPSAIFPSSLQTQFSGFSTPTPGTFTGTFGQQSTSSKKPSTQLLPSRTQSGSAFGQGNFYNKGTTAPQSFQQPGTQFGHKPTTIFPSSFQTQTSIFNTPSSATPQQNIFTSSKKPFGSQASFQFGQGNFGNKGTTVPVFQPSGTQFGYRPSTIGISPFQPRFGQQSISTSPKTPSSQQIIFGSRPTPQFGAGNLNNRGGTTVSQFQHPNQKIDTQFNYKPSIPSSTFAQSSIFNSQRPTTQFGQSSFQASKLPTSQTSQPGSVSTTTIGQGVFNNKESGDFQYQKPNQQFGTQLIYKPTTSIPGTQSSSFSSSKIPNTQSPQFNIQSSSPFDQSTFGNKGTTVPQFQSSQQPGTFDYKPSSSSQPQGSTFSSASTISQFGQTSDSTFVQKPIETSLGSENDNSNVNSLNKPSPLLPSTSQGTQFGDIYNYQKPVQNFVTPSESDNSNTQSQFSAQTNTQQGLPATQKEPEQSTNDKPDAQLNQESINDKDTSFNRFNQQKPESGILLNNQVTPTFPSTSQAQSTFSFDQSTGVTGEIYEYNKPDQGLPTSEKEETQFGQKLQASQIGIQSSGNGDNFDTNQETSPQLTQSTLSGSFGPQKLDSSTTQAPGSTTGSTSGSRPQFAFHSACCRGSIINRKPVSQNNLKPSDSFDQNKNPQKGSPTFAGVGEQFGGPRKPPSFDKNGYHY